MAYLIEKPAIEDLEIILARHAELFGLVSPEKYAKKWLKDLDDQQKSEITLAFRMIKQNDEIIAAAFLHPGGWLGELVITKGNEAAFDALIKDISAEGQYHVNFRTVPPSLQSILVIILEANGYKVSLKHDLSLNLLDFVTPTELNFEPIVWSKDLDATFGQVYEKYHPKPWLWDIVKYQTGGGSFLEELWFIHPNELAIVGINQPRMEFISESKVFNIVVVLGEDDHKKSLVQYAIWQCSMIDPIGIVNVHAFSKEIEFYQSIGFTINESHIHYHHPDDEIFK